MKYSKILSIAFVAMFVIGAFAVVADSDESSAVSAGSMNISVYNGSTWTDYTNLSGYNALQALQSSGATFTAATHDGYLSTDYIIQKTNNWGSYDEINSNYGDLLTVNGITETSENIWNTFYYDGSSWRVGPAAIGFIVPFTDGALASANVVLYYGAEMTTVPAQVSAHVGTSLKAMINPVNNGTYAMEFLIKVTAQGFTPSVTVPVTVTYYDEDAEEWDTKTLEASDIQNGIKIRGYGSNAYAALKNAVGNNVSATESYGGYNGWLNSLFGLQTVSTGSSYNYWSQNTGTGTYLSFVLGAYSTLDNVPTDYIGTTDKTYTMVGSSFELIYV